MQCCFSEGDGAVPFDLTGIRQCFSVYTLKKLSFQQYSVQLITVWVGKTSKVPLVVEPQIFINRWKGA